MSQPVRGQSAVDASEPVLTCLWCTLAVYCTVDMADPEAVVSPGGVGFDINCGVRLLRTNLTEKDVEPVKEKLTQALFDHIPVGVGSKGILVTNSSDLEAALVCANVLVPVVGGAAHSSTGRAQELGMDWSVRQGYSWVEDKEHCEEYGRMLTADPSRVSKRAKKRGLPQLGTLGACRTKRAASILS